MKRIKSKISTILYIFFAFILGCSLSFVYNCFYPKGGEILVDNVSYDSNIDKIMASGDEANEYKVITISKQEGGDFGSLSEACEKLNRGKYILFLKDTLYEEYITNDLNVKSGWIIKGKGMDKTKVVFHDKNPLGHRFNLNVTGSSRIYDVHFISIQTSDNNKYCLHLDMDIPNLQFICENVFMESKLDSNKGIVHNKGNMLSLGIGTWSNWNLKFKNCTIKCDERVQSLEKGFGAVNYHNNSGKESNTVFENCKIISTGNAFLIRDIRSESNSVKDMLSFINCDIKGYVVCYNTLERKNGYYFNVVNSNVTGILDVDYLIDSDIPGYDYNSIPQFNTVSYLENIGEEDCNSGTFISLAYDEKEYYWNTSDKIITPIGFKCSDSNPDGILLAKSNTGQSSHILLKGCAKIHDDYTIRSKAGDYVTIWGG